MFSGKLTTGIGAIVVGSLILVSTSACGSVGNGQSQAGAVASSEQQAQNQDTQNLEQNQPVPVYNYSQYRQTKIDVENIDATGANTTSFFFNLGVRDPIFICSSLGMPVPASAELTNPDQVIPDPNNANNNSGNPGSVTIGNPDPTGVYIGATTGTDVLCTSPNGKYIDYWEGYVKAISGTAVWDYNTHTMKLLGQPDKLSDQTNNLQGNSDTGKGVSTQNANVPTPTASN